MSRLRGIIEDYLRIRRSLGYSLQDAERRLLDFATFLEEASSSFITTDLAVRWATGSVSRSPRTAAACLGIVRRFAAFARALDPRTEVPPPDCLPYRARRPTPSLYSLDEIRTLVETIQGLRSPRFSRMTFSTLIGVLAVTGMRVGEAIGLDRSDFDRRQGLLTVRRGKFGKSRELPLHRTTQEALRAYEHERERTIPEPRDPAFFLSRKGKRLFHQNVSQTFDLVRRRAGLANRKPHRPRIHDLRHSFAVQTLSDWYRDGLDVEARLPLLSTYLGHVSPVSTYWYLTATPDLVGLAAQRLESAWGELP